MLLFLGFLAGQARHGWTPQSGGCVLAVQGGRSEVLSMDPKYAHLPGCVNWQERMKHSYLCVGRSSLRGSLGSVLSHVLFYVLISVGQTCAKFVVKWTDGPHHPGEGVFDLWTYKAGSQMICWVQEENIRPSLF